MEDAEFPEDLKEAIVEAYDKNQSKKDGKWTYWHKYEHRQKEEEVTYKDGKKDGLYTVWYKNGQKKEEETYKDGELVEVIGRWKEVKEVKEVKENGEKESEENYKDGTK